MFSSYIRNTAVAALWVGVMASTLTAPLSAQSPTVTYVAEGYFSSTIVSGTDPFKLAGQPFFIKVNASESAVPVKTGPGWAEYSPLKMSGSVQSGLLTTPITLSSTKTKVALANAKPTNDGLVVYAPVTVLGVNFTVIGEFQLPKGTLPGLTIAPFTAPVPLTSSITNVTYSYTENGVPNTTVLTISNGSLSTTVTGAALPEPRP